MKLFKEIIAPALIAGLIAINVMEGLYIHQLKSVDVSPCDTVTVAIADTLSDWDMFTLALMKVESDFDPSAVSSVGAKGYFQITPIYVKEVNRIHKTNYTFDQVTDFNTAWTIFDLMQKAHNPDYSMDKALVLHNGNRDWYKRRVYAEMARIRQYEEMRHKVKSI